MVHFFSYRCVLLLRPFLDNRHLIKKKNRPHFPDLPQRRLTLHACTLTATPEAAPNMIVRNYPDVCQNHWKGDSTA